MGTTYEKVRDLGKVPLGSAWIGCDADSGLEVVVKHIPLVAIGGGGNGWTHLVDQTRMLTRIGHPQISPALEVGEEGDDLVMVTVRPSGRRLSEIMEESGPVSVDQIRRWILPVMEGLAIAHDSGVIHRHVHESLVIIDDKDNAVLTGFALTLDSRVEPDPIPPELLNGGKATPRSDQYLVGAMLERLAAVAEPIPAMDIVITRAMEEEPGRRFPDLVDMMQSLEAVLDSVSTGVLVHDADEPEAEKALFAKVVESEIATPETDREIEEPKVLQDLHGPARPVRRRRYWASAVAAAAIITVGLGLVVATRNNAPLPTVAADDRVVGSREEPMARVGELLAEGRLEQAAAQLQQLLDASELEDPTPALDALGTIRLQEGRGDEAVDLFQRALGLHAAEGLYYKLSLAQASAGRGDQALRTVNEGLRLYPESQRLQEARYHLGGV